MIQVGTSGWQYDDWKGRFYPNDVPKTRWLEYFSARFPTVEVNNTFYRLPREQTFAGWRDRSAPGFCVAVKASRYITHIRRLRDCEESIKLLWSRCRQLGPKLGPVLFQLPPRFDVDPALLERFVRLIPPKMKAAFEFRDRSWERPDVYEILDRAGAAFVYADSPGARVPQVVCGGWCYVRFHKGGRTKPGYSRTKLNRWADRIAALDASETWVYFNNDTGGAAIEDAQVLGTMLRERGCSTK